MLKLDNIFIINLKHRTDRREHIIRQMNQQGIHNYEFFDAIKPTIEEVRQWNKQFCHHVIQWVRPEQFNNYQIGCLGCLKSHLEVQKLALKRGYKRIMILEDDTEFIQPWDYFQNTVSQLSDYDMLYLSGSHMKQYKRLSNMKNIVKVTETNTTCSYCISEKAMKFFVSNIDSFPKEVDIFFSNVIQQKFDCFCMVPHITKQLDGYSDIQGTNVAYKL